jgi:hypothetical protein
MDKSLISLGNAPRQASLAQPLAARGDMMNGNG